MIRGHSNETEIISFDKWWNGCEYVYWIYVLNTTVERCMISTFIKQSLRPLLRKVFGGISIKLQDAQTQFVFSDWVVICHRINSCASVLLNKYLKSFISFLFLYCISFVNETVLSKCAKFSLRYFRKFSFWILSNVLKVGFCFRHRVIQEERTQKTSLSGFLIDPDLINLITRRLMYFSACIPTVWYVIVFRALTKLIMCNTHREMRN